MKWNELTQPEHLVALDEVSKNEKVFIFKHSTRCSISTAALNRIERKWSESDTSLVKPYFLDLLAFRKISNEIADHYNIEHESPQLLVIENGKCTFVDAHFDISYDALMQNISA